MNDSILPSNSQFHNAMQKKICRKINAESTLQIFVYYENKFWHISSLSVDSFEMKMSYDNNGECKIIHILKTDTKSKSKTQTSFFYINV